jgi:hypothetical protein
MDGKGARGWERGDFFLRYAWRRPKRLEGPGEQEALTRRNELGGSKGYGFLDGRKPLERRWEAFLKGFFRGAQERREFSGRGIRSFKRRKALKGEARECSELRETSEG